MAILPSPSALAQVSRLNKSTLIDALTREGMNELLLRLMKTQPPTDPVEAAQMQIARYRLQYKNTSLDWSARTQAYENALDGMRKLIADFPKRVERPIWQTDLARMLLGDYLQVIHRNAAAFYTFGVPGKTQEQAFEKAAVEALEAAASASLRLVQLRDHIERDKQQATKLQNSGLFARLFDDYADQRTPFFLAMAAQYVALLPDDAAYFHNPDAKVPGKLGDATEERARLAHLAVARIQPFAHDASMAGGARMPALAILGGAQLTLRRYDEAIRSYQPILDADQDDLYELMACLGTAHALAAQKQYPAALDKLTTLGAQPWVKASPLDRVLVADAQHRVLMTQAHTAPKPLKAQTIAAAYQPYMDLLNDPSLGTQTQAMRMFIYTRWAQRIDPNVDPKTLPPMVRLGVSEIDRIQGQNAVIAAQKNKTATPTAILAKLHRAITLARTLVGKNTPDSIRARAMFNLGLATYYTDPNDVRTILSASATLTKLADELPAQSQAEQAITYAISLLHSLHQMDPVPPGVDQAYRHTATVLYNKFPTTTAADNERLYYGYSVLESAGEYQQAARILLQTPPRHPDYFPAQREALFALAHVMERASPADQDDARENLVTHARQIQQDAQARLASHAAPEQRTDESAGKRRADAQPQAAGAGPQSALAAAQIVLAQAAMSRGKVDQAIKELDGFEKRFSDLPALLRMALEQRIVALARAGRLDQVSTAATTMMNRFPDDAAGVINQVLTHINDRIEQLRTQAASELSTIRQKELHAQAVHAASTASMLSQLLLDWAQKRHLSEQDLLPYQLIRVKSLRLSGQVDQAVTMSRGLINTFPDNAQTIHQYAQSLFAKGDPVSLKAAAGYYDKLILGLTPPYPDLWWNAWMRRLQINDLLHVNTDDIALHIRQLKRIDTKLGGPRYKPTFDRLAEKHPVNRQ